MALLKATECFKRWRRNLVILGDFLGVLLLLVVVFPQEGDAHLNLSKQCGELICQEHEYCRDFDHTCNSCEVICKEGSNNFSKDTCEAGCQDYLHDERYMRLRNGVVAGEDVASLYQSLQKDVLVLKILVAVCLVIIALLLASFTAFLVYFWRWRNLYDNSSSSITLPTLHQDKDKGGKGQDKGKMVDLPIIYDNRYGLRNSPEPRRRHNDSPTKSEETIASNNSTGAVTMSTLVDSKNSLNHRFRKEPSESTIPDMGHDNHSISPSHGYTHHV